MSRSNHGLRLKLKVRNTYFGICGLNQLSACSRSPRQLKHPIDKFHYDVMEAITAANIIAQPFIDMPRG